MSLCVLKTFLAAEHFSPLAITSNCIKGHLLKVYYSYYRTKQLEVY